MKTDRNRLAFTLIELMVVVIIIAALAAMVVPKVLPATTDAKRRISKGDIANISMALKLYRLHNDKYPSTEDGLGILLKPSTSKDWKDSYLEKAAVDPWERKYQYVCPGSHSQAGFDLWSMGPDGQTGGGDDITNWD
ncbi:MAG: type II secretion system protein GspG [Verrucomicrobia bacterium]|nr:type II secretion system protein GspG [Verrucomicrobiota bacterium]